MAWGMQGWLSGLFQRNQGPGQLSQLASANQGIGGVSSAGQASPRDFSIAPAGTYASGVTSSGAYDPSGYSIAPAGSYPGQAGGSLPQQPEQPGALSKLAQWGKERVGEFLQPGAPDQQAEQQVPQTGEPQSQQPVPQSEPPAAEGEPKTPLQPSGTGKDVGGAFMMNTADPFAEAKVEAANRELRNVSAITAAVRNIAMAAAGGAAGAGSGGAPGAGPAAGGATPTAAGPAAGGMMGGTAAPTVGGSAAPAAGGTGFMASFKGGYTGAGGGGSRLGGALGSVTKQMVSGQGGGGGGTQPTPTVGVSGTSQQPTEGALSMLAETEATRRPGTGSMGGMPNPGGQMSENIRSLDYAKRHAKIVGLMGGGVQQSGPYRWFTGMG